MDNGNLVIRREISDFFMYYSGCSMCLEPEWVDNPDAAIIFQDEELAERTVGRLKAIALSDFPITLVPIRVPNEDEEE